MPVEPWKQKCKQKIIEPNLLSGFVGDLKKSGKTIATLNGSFDLMHAGHLHIIYEASQVADFLFVLLNTDSSIQRYKCPKRPIISLEYRMEMMAALQFVDYISWFDETDPRSILSTIQPHIHVNGAEYGENCMEAEVVKKHGGKMHIVHLVPGLSTSAILEKIRQI